MSDATWWRPAPSCEARNRRIGKVGDFDAFRLYLGESVRRFVLNIDAHDRKVGSEPLRCRRLSVGDRLPPCLEFVVQRPAAQRSRNVRFGHQMIEVRRRAVRIVGQAVEQRSVCFGWLEQISAVGAVLRTSS